MKKALRAYAHSYIKEIRLFGILAALFIAFSAISPERFLSSGNLSTMVRQMPELGLLTLAIMLVIVTGGNNLSNVATAILSAIVMALVMSALYASGSSELISILAGLGSGLVVALLCGALNGLFSAVIGVAAMLATLASSTFFRGISMNITQGAAISGFPVGFYNMSRADFLGIPVLFWIFIVCAVVTHILLSHTQWGRSVYMLGCNPTATEYSGVTVKKVLFKIYLLSAALSFVAGVVMTSRYNSAKVDYGSSYLLQSLTASVLGGVEVTGGSGTVAGCVISVMILQVISSGMNILNVNRFFTDIITGAILILTLALNYFFRKAGARKAKSN